MELKVENTKLAEVISVGTLEGKFESVVLNFKDDGLHIKSKDGDNTIMNLVFMPKTSFELYKEVKNLIGIRNSNILLNVLKSFNGIINLKVEKDLINIYDNKKVVTLKTADVTYLDDNNLNETPKVFEKFDAGVKINTDILKNSIKNISIVKSDNIKINIKNKLLSIETGDEGFDKITEKINCAYNNNVSAFFNSELFKNVVAVLKDEVIISLPKSNFPIQLTTKTDNFHSKILIAPNDDLSEEVKEEKKVTTETTIDDLVEKEISSEDELL